MKKILLVEDEPELINIMDLVIRDEGYQVTQMSNAEDALQYCSKSTPDLIITDIKMGAMDGLTMFEKIRSMPKFEQVPLIVISAFSESQWRTRAKELGATEYFTKPFDVDDVVSAVRRALDPSEKLPPIPNV